MIPQSPSSASRSSPHSFAAGAAPAGELIEIQRRAQPLVPVPQELLRQLRVGLPVFLTTELWDAFVVPPATASRDETATMRVRRIVSVMREVLVQVPAGRDAARFSFQVKNRPLFWDTVHAWVAVHVEQPEGVPALVVGLEKLDEPGAL